MMRPSARIRIAARSALRRRYGYAALRHLRRGVSRALEAHRAASIGARAYAGEPELAIRTSIAAALRKLLKRWPALNLSDPRSRP